MVAKYTPGPWNIGSSDLPVSRMSIHCKGHKESCHSTIALMVSRMTIGISHDEEFANARLIAAAPELLEALRKYELPIDINNIALSCIEFGSEAVERELQRRAAIAKATGEPQ